MAQPVKNLPALQETWVHSLFWEGPWRRGWLPSPVFWPGEFHVLYSSWGRKESDMTEQLKLSLSGQDGGSTALSPKNQLINSVMRIDGSLYLLILNIKQHHSWTSRDKIFHPCFTNLEVIVF